MEQCEVGVCGCGQDFSNSCGCGAGLNFAGADKNFNPHRTLTDS